VDAFWICRHDGSHPLSALAMSFPPQLAGRVSTGLNVLVFIAPSPPNGHRRRHRLFPSVPPATTPARYHASFAILLVLQALCLAWYALPVFSRAILKANGRECEAELGGGDAGWRIRMRAFNEGIRFSEPRSPQQQGFEKKLRALARC